MRRVATDVAVMYLGQVVETAPRDAIYARPLHPYTRALMQAAPRPDPRRERGRLQAPIPGEVPSSAAPPPGCRFHPRCPLARPVCSTTARALRLIAPQHSSACHFAGELAASPGCAAGADGSPDVPGSG